MNKKNQAFTLVELMVAIMIIGLLSSVVTVSLKEIRRNSRDIKRVSDISQIQLYLEQYYKDEGFYPESLNFGESLVGSTTDKVYMTKIPKNPTPASNKCSYTEYEYKIDKTSNVYNLKFCLEGETDSFENNENCVEPTRNKCFTCGEDTVKDADGNLYETISINGKCWFKDNLKTTKYNDKSVIINASSESAWSSNVLGAYVWYNNNESSYKNTYGALYNWYAVNTNKICPPGWIVPSDEELTSLINYLGGLSVAGGKLKEVGTSHWSSPNQGATDESQLTMLPGGLRHATGSFGYINGYGYFWSSTIGTNPNSWYIRLDSASASVFRNSNNRNFGFSVRCIKEE